MGMQKMQDTLQSEHAGFAITLEVLCTLVMMFTMLFLVLFLIMVMNAQRFMNTVLTTTAAEASRWGGVPSRAYELNVGGTPLLTSSQQKLNATVPEYHAVITGYPNSITYNGQPVTVTVTYHIPTLWNFGKVHIGNAVANVDNTVRNLSMTVRVASNMGAGGLIS